MARNAKRNDIISRQKEVKPYGSGLDMVDVKLTAILSALLASVIVSLYGVLNEAFIVREHSITDSIAAVFVIAMFTTALHAVWILPSIKALIPGGMPALCLAPLLLKLRVTFKAVINLRPIVKGFMALLVSHAFKCRASLFGKTLIPCGTAFPKPSLVVSMTIFGVIVFPGIPALSEAGSHAAAAALAGSYHGDYNHAIHYTLKVTEGQENRVNCWEALPGEPGVISSQAAVERSAEGPTTMEVSTNNNPPHERPTRKGRYSLSTGDDSVKHGINSHAVTILNSIPFTFKVTELSKFDLEKIIKEGLADDMAKCIDGLIEREYNSTPLRYVGTATNGFALTTNGTATATNTSGLNTYHVRKMILELKKRNVPGWGSINGDYVCIASHEAMEGMMGALESVFQNTESGTTKLLNGEVGRYFGCRFIGDGFATRFTYSSTNRTATAKAFTGANSLDAYMFGSPTVKEAVVTPEQIRAKEITDYGRSHGLAWYFLGGYKIMWDDAANARIIKWDSA